MASFFSKVISAALIVLLAFACTGCGNEPDIPYGKVVAVSGGTEYAPVENWIFSLNEDGVAADGARMKPEDLEDDLPAVPCGDDLHIAIDGEIWGQAYYTLYDDDYNEIYYNRAAFEPPVSEGTYILCVELAWGDADRYEGYQYFWRLTK